MALSIFCFVFMVVLYQQRAMNTSAARIKCFFSKPFSSQRYFIVTFPYQSSNYLESFLTKFSDFIQGLGVDAAVKLRTLPSDKRGKLLHGDGYRFKIGQSVSAKNVNLFHLSGKIFIGSCDLDSTLELVFGHVYIIPFASCLSSFLWKFFCVRKYLLLLKK